jgi:hypothetical protein
MMKKKKQSGARGKKAKGGRKSTESRRPKVNGPPQDKDINVGSSGTGFHDHNIIWHNPGNVDETVDFYTSEGCPLAPSFCPSFVVPKNGGTVKTPIRHDALGEYTYRTIPNVPRTVVGGDPTVIIQ